MPLTNEELRQRLNAIEPSEGTYSGLGPADVDALSDLMRDEEAWLAARAVHALARIDEESARGMLVRAAADPRPEIRIAAARVAERVQPDTSDQLLTKLLGDPDPGVRKFALTATTQRNSEGVKELVRARAASEPIGSLRSVAQAKLQAFDRG